MITLHIATNEMPEMNEAKTGFAKNRSGNYQLGKFSIFTKISEGCWGNAYREGWVGRITEEMIEDGVVGEIGWNYNVKALFYFVKSGYALQIGGSELITTQGQLAKWVKENAEVKVYA